MILADLLIAITAVSSLDILVFLLLLWGGYKGYQKGFLVELVLMFVFVIAVVTIFKGVQASYDTASQRFGDFGKSFPFFTFIILYALISLGISLLGKKLVGLMPNLFENFDAVLGMILGVMKYAIFMGILFKLFISVGIMNEGEVRSSTIFYTIIMDIFNKLLEVGTVLSPFIGDLVDKIEKLLQ